VAHAPRNRGTVALHRRLARAAAAARWRQ